MKNLRTEIVLLLAVCLCFVLSACGKNAPQSAGGAVNSSPAESAEVQPDTEESSASTVESGSSAASNAEEEIQQARETEKQGSDVLVVYFSATGTTKGVAEQIAAIEGTELYEILPAEPYTEADRDWNDSDSRTTKEQSDPSVRPEIASEPIELTVFSRIYVGYPIWWGQAPRIMDTFVESHDFGEAVVIPFCTSASSGIGSSGQTLAELAGSGTWLEGARFGGNVSKEELESWSNGLE